MGSFRFLALVRPFAGAIPEIAPPAQKIPFQSRMLWIATAIGIYFVGSQIRLYGIQSSDSPDPLFALRTVLASTRGSLLDVGPAPIVTSGMVLQLLAGARLIDVDFTLAEDRALFATTQKLFAALLSLVQAISYVASGFYGSPLELGVSTSLLLVLQLTLGALSLIGLDELLVRGYGVGAGATLFTIINICQNVVWKTFSPSTITTSHGPEYEGAVPALVHLFFTWYNKTRALTEAFFRGTLPNVSGLLSTVLVFLIVVYFQGFRIEVPIKSVRFRGQQGRYPIKLLYTSSLPLLLITSLTGYYILATHLLALHFPSHLLVRVLGTFAPGDDSKQLRAVSGLAYYLSPTTSLESAIKDPIHTVLHSAIVVVASALISKSWINVSGSGPRDVAKQLKDNGMVMVGHREDGMYKELKRVIPTAAIWGGVTVGVLAVGADVLGVFGSGAGVILAVTYVYNYFEWGVRESGGPEMNALGDLLG